MISQRLRGVQADGEAIEEEGFMPKLKAAFDDVGVSIEDQNGELRSTYDILNDLATKWDTLSSKQKQFLGEKAAGNRQVKTLNAIMANWDVVRDTIQKADEATGAATEGNEKYLDSIEGRITQFKSAFQDLSCQTFDSSFVKGFVELGTNILKLTADIGGLQRVLVPTFAALATFKWPSIVSGVAQLGAAFKKTSVEIDATTGKVTKSLGEFSKLRIGLTAAIAVVGVAMAAYQKYRESIERRHIGIVTLSRFVHGMVEIERQG